MGEVMPIYRRKVQKIGKNTFIITLPSSWAKGIGLEPKSEILLEILPDMSLRIYKASAVRSRGLVADFKVDEGYNEHDIAREIIAYYIAGASIIRIFYDGVMRSVVDRAISIARDRLIGLEVVDEDINIITLQVVVDPNLSDIESVVKRLKRIVISMHRDILQYLFGEANPSILDSVIARDNLADKLYLLALRQLTQVLRDPHEMGRRGIDYVEAMHRVMFIKSLERVADHAVNMARIVIKFSSISKELVELYKETIDLFDEMAEALIDMNKQKAVELVKHVERLRMLDEEARRSIDVDKETNYYLTRFMDIVSRILARTVDAEETIVDINAIKSLRSSAIETISGEEGITKIH